MKLSDEELARFRDECETGLVYVPSLEEGGASGICRGFIAHIDAMTSELSQARAECGVAQASYAAGLEVQRDQLQRIEAMEAELAAMRAGAPDGWVPPTNVTHELKTWPEPFEAIRTGHKTCEVRKNDRGFAVGDTLHLREWRPDTGAYTGRDQKVMVTHKLVGFGLPDDMCALSIQPAKIDAAPQPPAQTVAVKVKPANWQVPQWGESGRDYCLPAIGPYSVHGNNWYLGQDYMGTGGKAAAEAHRRTAILSAINACPVDDIRADERDKMMASLWAKGWVIQHTSDCAVHNEPASPAGPCNCGAERARNGVKAEALREMERRFDQMYSERGDWAASHCRIYADRLDPKGGA